MLHRSEQELPEPLHRCKIGLKIHVFEFIVSFDLQLTSVQRTGNKLEATFVNEITGQTSLMIADQTVVERGTLPADTLYHEIRTASANDGVTDIDRLLAGEAQPEGENGAFRLYRIGDAVSSRNIYSAILDAARLCNTI